MRLFHISDIHLGRQLHGYSLQEEQRAVLRQIMDVAGQEKPDALLICGDIYDRSVPSGEAMGLFDEFLVGLGNLPFQLPVLIIAGNHDSPERLRYGREFLREHQIYISVLPPQREQEHLEKVTLRDEQGAVHFYLLPFFRPGMVRHYLPEEAAAGEESILRALLERENINWQERNVLLSHQFYHSDRDPLRCQSEQPRLAIGGLDGVDSRLVKDFDYVALGHLHSPQSVGSNTIRYCGTPLAYSVSEAGQQKSITVIELGRKGEPPKISMRPLVPKRRVRCLRGTLGELVKQAGDSCVTDYVSLTLTQEEVPENLRQLLEPYYSAILEIVVDNERSRRLLEEIPEETVSREQEPGELFAQFFEETQGREMNEEEKALLREIICERGEESD